MINDAQHIECPKYMQTLKSGKSLKIFYPLFGLSALIWIVFRVVTKPSRAGYPCVNAAAPVAAGFIYYLMGIIISALSLQKAKKLFENARYFTAFIFTLVGIFSGIHLYSIDSRPAIANTIQYDIPNNPMGTGMGIFPGRVIWAHNPDATNENCSNNWGDGYFLEKNSNLQVIEEMVTKSLIKLTGQSSIADAWDSLFVYFNHGHNKGRVTYTAGEKIFIKTNGVGTSSLNDDYELTRHKDYEMSRTSPQTLLIVLRHLVNECGIAQTDISVGDPMTNVIKEYSRNLETGEGIELIQIMRDATSIEPNIDLSSIETFELFQNYPNPFNPTTTISYSIEIGDKTSLVIYDNAGKKIKELMDADHTPGYYKIVWDGRDIYNRPVSSGVYFAALKSGSLVRVIKLMLVR